MIFLQVLQQYSIFCSSDLAADTSCNLARTSANPNQKFSEENFTSLAEFFDYYNDMTKNHFLSFNNNNFVRFLEIINLYPCGDKKNHIISSMCFLRLLSDKLHCYRVLLSHEYPNINPEGSASLNLLHLRPSITFKEIIDLKNLMMDFKNYYYFDIFDSVKNDDLLYYISLSSLVENMGIIYLRLLSKKSYYRTNRYFIKDFITHTASFLHSVNLIYRAGLSEEKVMNVFKTFAFKNQKLLCIYMNMWILSYNSILEGLKNHGRSFRIFSNKNNIQVYTEGKKCKKLDAFNSEIKLLFNFILNIDMNLNFRKEFEILKKSRNFNFSNIKNMINIFDQEGLLDFYTESKANGNNEMSYKDADYFLNSLDVDSPILAKISEKLLFIYNNNIKKYFVDICWIAYLKNYEKLEYHLEHLLKNLDLKSYQNSKKGQD